MYGRNPNVSLDLMLDLNTAPPPSVLKMDEIRKQASENLAKAQQVQNAMSPI